MSMPETLAPAVAGALAHPGFWWLAVTLAAAGIVRGFTGFGSALIFVPIAGIFLPPVHVIAIIALVEIASIGALVPRAWAHADRGQVGLLVLAALPTVPLGLWIMDALDATIVRWIVAAFAGGTLIALISGWHYAGRITLPVVVAIGAVAGLLGGMTGLTGPVVVLFYLAGGRVAKTVRANTILFLGAMDLVIVGNLLLRGFADMSIIWLAAVLSVPYFTGMITGQALFQPSYEALYRRAALTVIALAVLAGLPIWQ
ncbi:sulfite exporter TauE/SafE family protein [Roseovarius nanhaiticus]|uniref:sulfite exporter TauE/SafE family protein n=1 Tax=Roseovarius nanhaiticus TaxID=573024 RepID=UPI002492DE4C|nr:sulfite exporter TauE/SafE family protein [Roseovarius nanhaiticus]